MIDAAALLADLRKLVARLEGDLRERCREVSEVGARLRSHWEKAREGQRTGLAFETWCDEHLAQVASSWALATVFVRFLEDNGLVDPPRLGGTGERLTHARDERTLYFRAHPTHTDRDWLEHVLRAVAALPAMGPLLDEGHNPLWSVGLSADGAADLVRFWHETDPATGLTRRDFTDEAWGTRFLGDLYQDLSDVARDRYALLQTPEFVESLILDRTLEPAIVEFGYQEVRLIDPACGSGHFLLGAFDRLLRLWTREEPGRNERDVVQKALDAVHGVDLNPFAVAIARFRLLLAALQACGARHLSKGEAPGFTIHVTAADSLLHSIGQRSLRGLDTAGHLYETEHFDEIQRILQRRYHVVVGNPPYITAKDPALNDAYRRRFQSCSGKYSMVVPFLECFFDLALVAEGSRGTGPGFVGMIASNAFMKREFGKRLIEKYVPRWDLTHVVDTSGAYIPGHGTPTVILFGRNRPPVSGSVRAVMGIRGEPETPADPAKGQVWSTIINQIDDAGSVSPFVSVTDVPRERFHKHPWSLGGGGAAELKETVQANGTRPLRDAADAVGVMAVAGEDEVFIFPDSATLKRLCVSVERARPLVEGDVVRDWTVATRSTCLYPYDAKGAFELIPSSERHLWSFRTALRTGVYFGKTNEARGMDWREYGVLVKDKLRTPLSIAFAEVATHNHFVLDRGGKVFKQTAPVIKLPPAASADDHLALLGPLNSSTGCFWMQQVFHNKGGPGGACSKDEKWHDFYQHDSTKLKAFPLPATAPLAHARALDSLARELAALQPPAIAQRETPTRERLEAAHEADANLRMRMVAIQEELDWECYRLYGLLDEALTMSIQAVPPIRLGERAFEIVMARRMERGELTTTWFDRHGSRPITRVPGHWPDEYRRLVERRITVIETHPDVGLVEKPEYKRRWAGEAWEERVRARHVITVP